MKSFIDQLVRNNVPKRNQTKNIPPNTTNTIHQNKSPLNNQQTPNEQVHQSPTDKIVRKPMQTTTPLQKEYSSPNQFNSTEQHFQRKNKPERQIFSKTNDFPKTQTPPVELVQSFAKTATNPYSINRQRITPQPPKTTLQRTQSQQFVQLKDQPIQLPKPTNAKTKFTQSVVNNIETKVVGRVSQTKKIQTIADKTNKAPQKIQPKPKSNLIIYSIAKYHKSNMANSIRAIQQQLKKTTKKANVYIKILIESMLSIHQQSQLYYMSLFFKSAKSSMVKIYSNDNKSRQSTIINNYNKTKSILPNILAYKYRSHLKAPLQKLLQLKNKIVFSQRAIVTLTLLQKRKIASALRHLKKNTQFYDMKKTKQLQDILLISNIYLQKLKRLAFDKMISYNLPKKQKISQKTISPKIKPIIESPPKYQMHNQQTQLLQLKISQKKDNFETQQNNILQMIEDLKATLNLNNQKVNNISQSNQQLKLLLEKIQSQSNNQNGEFQDNAIITILSKIYIQLMNHNNIVEIKQIEGKYGLPLDTQDQAISDWQILQSNTKLRWFIQKIQGLQRDRKSVEILSQENRVVDTLIRSYVKQRYLWQCVKVSIAQV